MSLTNPSQLHFPQYGWSFEVGELDPIRGQFVVQGIVLKESAIPGFDPPKIRYWEVTLTGVPNKVVVPFEFGLVVE